MIMGFDLRKNTLVLVTITDTIGKFERLIETIAQIDLGLHKDSGWALRRKDLWA